MPPNRRPAIRHHRHHMKGMNERDQPHPDPTAQAEDSELSALPASPGYGLEGKALADYLTQLSNQDDEKSTSNE
ncbi:MAG: hypothetical protein EA353_01775 [Puniceicoccaceae bacterium]|nr:MAG: hypothetical protein EA353_01775 [Puniceicoccaceae bacterium]